MADERLEQLLRFRWWHVGDPPVLIDTILDQVEKDQRQQILTHYLDLVVATHEANLRFVQNVRSAFAGARTK
jgi:hypothetical protein